MRKLLLPLLFAALAFGLAQLFLLRFQAGDVYPPYSSLRADPLGAKILYESLASLRHDAGVAVSRNYQPLEKLRDRPQPTLFLLGVEAGVLDKMDEDQARNLESVAAGGGRLVVSFLPAEVAPSKSLKRDTAKEKVKEKKAGRRKLGDEETKSVALRERWNLGVDYARLPRKDDDTYDAVEASRQTKDELPDSVSWHTALLFKNPDKAWRVIYARDDRPVLMERKFGRGTIVLSADSYFLSNEAMRDERHPSLLAWLAGSNRELVFDESHFGVREEAGVMALARKYRLHGLFAGLLLLAGLFVWRNVVSFVPPGGADPALERELATGKDAAAGLINLLRRTIPARELALVCFEEWKKSFAHRKEFAAKLERLQTVANAEAALPAGQRQPVQTYQTISRILAERK